MPFTSVTVRVTELEPVLEQLKLVVLRLRELILQLSLLPLSISPAVMVTEPVPSSCAVIFWQTAVGEVVSCTVTTEVQVEELALPSTTVRVTLLVPTLLQVKAVVLAVVPATEQLSQMPLSMSPAAMETLPLPSRCTVMFWHTAVGEVESVTTTDPLQVLEFPLTSTTVKVTVLLPRLEQVNADVLRLSELTLQLSEEPLSMSPVVMEALPLASRWTVRLLQDAVGEVVS